MPSGRSHSKKAVNGGRARQKQRPPRSAVKNVPVATDVQPLIKTPVRRDLPTNNPPLMSAGNLLEIPSFPDYELLDSGFGKKLERYGKILVVRPEEQAIWQPTLSESEWNKADALFAGNDEDDDNGRWRFQNKLSDGMVEDAWQLSFKDVKFFARFTAFRHMGFFPEQAAHWDWFSSLIKKAGRPIKVLNLFGYTGVASLIAAKAGAHVTHIDASKKAIGWARDNQGLSGLEEAPIRWICEDATKFVARAARRGDFYDGIIMDPPKYGRGPKGEVWHYFEDVPELLHQARAILSDQPLFFILSSYAIRASFLSSHELCRDVFAGLGGKVESGELILNQSNGSRQLSTSLYTRWSEAGGA